MAESVKPNVSFLTNCHLEVHNINNEDNASLYGVYLGVSVINCLASFIEVAGNGLVIAVIVKTPALHLPTNTLLCCLAVSDFLTGLLSQPSYTFANVMAMKSSPLYCSGFMVAYLINYFLSGVSFITVTLLNFDRYLSLSFPLRYNQLISNKMALQMVALSSILIGALIVLPIVGENNTFKTMVTIAMVINMVLNASLCCIIFRIIRKHKARIDAERHLSIRLHQSSQMEFKVCKKTSMTTIYITLLYFLCYAPYFGVALTVAVNGEETMALKVRIVWHVAATVVCLNACLNPLLYCYRIKTIRSAVYKMLRERICAS